MTQTPRATGAFASEFCKDLAFCNNTAQLATRSERFEVRTAHFAWTSRTMDAIDGVRMFDAPNDPALRAATLALTGGARRHASRFASIELRARDSALSRIVPLGYAISVIAALCVVVLLWLL